MDLCLQTSEEGPIFVTCSDEYSLFSNETTGGTHLVVCLASSKSLNTINRTSLNYTALFPNINHLTISLPWNTIDGSQLTLVKKRSLKNCSIRVRNYQWTIGFSPSRVMESLLIKFRLFLGKVLLAICTMRYRTDRRGLAR